VIHGWMQPALTAACLLLAYFVGFRNGRQDERDAQKHERFVREMQKVRRR